jgi:hypothetical protein
MGGPPSTLRSNAYVLRSLPKATDWSGTLNSKPSKEINLSWYQSVDKKYLRIYIKFEVGLSIPFTSKMSSKKSETFSKVCPFFKLINEKLSLRRDGQAGD